jgi:phenylpropionate dioxygenase-like ring-hydroxylating dioxygenase large terminal subunit
MSTLPAAATAGQSPHPDAATWPASWHTLPHGIAVGRYIDPAFLRLEYERLWSRVWQAAARADEIPATGDYTTYEIGDQSFVVVRVDESTLKTYRNFCPHRGTALSQGCGNFAGGRIICPFHGWRWDLAGNNEFVLERQEFRDGKLRASDVALREVPTVVFAGFVFINPGPDPQPFDEFIAPVRQWIEDFAIGDMHHYWWKSIAVPANWKVAQEAFFEAYHVSATHPQLDKVGREVVYGNRQEGDFNHRNVLYDALPHGHGRFYGGKKTPMAGHLQEPKGDPVDEMAARMALIADGMGAMVLQEDVDVIRSLRGKPIPEGSHQQLDRYLQS